MALDIIDVKILEVLQENSRVSLSELSKRINLSLSAVSERLKKLETSGVIDQYTAVLDSKAMNKSLRAVMRVDVEGSSTKSELMKLVESTGEILECYFVTGTCDYILILATENTDSLAALINKVKAIKGVRGTVTDVVLSTMKMKHSVSPVATKE